MKIKIRVSGRHIIATPINSTIPPKSNKSHLSRGGKGLPAGAGNRIRNAVHELGPSATFSTVLLDECPDSKILNRIRTHLQCDAVGVVEFGIKNGWHLHIIHLRSVEDADKILSNYGRCHHEQVREGGRSAWYLTKNIGIIPPSEHPKSWYFCSRDLGRDEIFYIDSTVLEVTAVGVWQIKDYFLIAVNTFTTLNHLKKLPRYPEE
jgi:hypothetical protein